ncbi:MAG TPA: DNA/RNA nuclease SfsA [Gammaproteobacteria bacterium]|nr:DNA/RNA nuclease SfsA [Gammaproteobacteria bacterium]
MRFDPPLIPARLIRRYKRFLADVVLESGETITVHTPNTGSMQGCAEPGMRVWLRDTAGEKTAAKRKYRYSWDASETAQGVVVGVNTLFANRLVEEAIEEGIIESLSAYTGLRREVRYGEKSRVDLLLEEGMRRCYVEVKNVTAVAAPGVAIFPDAVTTRGRRHLVELAAQVDRGHRAVMLFCIPRADVTIFQPAWAIDDDYARTLCEVAEQGVEIYAYKGDTTPSQSRLVAPVDVDLTPLE